ncbi:T9SS type A sorting domain-containing protein [Sediminibacter sp. Hel_I_10]|uniref:T9SS type A sorting domain-containing protein n=1 Tax=Sediminibacter sp. Hel_I_10 TaxID=1392490 RepID=UPI00047D402F|nr:T9SS type A sorting domain-containing protein [Sediminibacter sp. Hel_I_10]
MLSPNPSQGKTALFYNLVNKGEVTILLSDPTGRALWQKTEPFQKGQITIDTQDYASGYYPIVLFQNGKVVGRVKLIVN